MRVLRGRHRATMTLTGELDLNGAPQLTSCADRLHHQGPADLDIDLHGLTFCDAAGLSALLAIRRDAEGTKRRFRMLDPPECLLKIIRVLGLDESFT